MRFTLVASTFDNLEGLALEWMTLPGDRYSLASAMDFGMGSRLKRSGPR